MKQNDVLNRAGLRERFVFYRNDLLVVDNNTYRYVDEPYLRVRPGVVKGLVSILNWNEKKENWSL